LQLLHGPHLIGQGIRAGLHAGGAAGNAGADGGDGIGLCEEGTDGVGEPHIPLRQEPVAVAGSAAEEPQTGVGGLIGDEAERRHLLLQLRRRLGVAAVQSDVLGLQQGLRLALGPVVAVAVGSDLAAVVVGGAEAAAVLADAVFKADV